MRNSIRACLILILGLGVLSPAIFGKEYIVLYGNANHDLANAVVKRLGETTNLAKIDKFNDGEINIKIEKSVRGKDVYIIQSIAKSDNNSVNDNLMELYLLIRTLKRSNAGNITAIIPYYGYARQDRKTESRVPISASDVAMLLEHSGLDRVVALDLHAGQIQGFFHNVPVDNIYGSIFMSPKFAELKLKNPVVVSPDTGGVARAKKFREALSMYGVEADLAIIIKQRAKAGVVASANLIGDVNNRDVIIVDDICDTGGTLVKAAEELKKFGANKIYASITHPVFSKDAIEKIENSVFEQVFVSDSISIKKGSYKKISQISVANLLAIIIDLLHRGEPLSDLFLPNKSYLDEHGESKIQAASKVFPNHKFNNSKLVIDKTQNINVLVASESVLKINAARSLFSDRFSVDTKAITMHGYKTESGVSEQPIGLEEALKGARNRIQYLKNQYQISGRSHSYIVGIENFFTELEADRQPTDHALVLIEDPKGIEHIGISVGVEINKNIYKLAMQQDNLTIGKILASIYHVDSSDWHGYVTNNKITRQQQIITAF